MDNSFLQSYQQHYEQIMLEITNHETKDFHAFGTTIDFWDVMAAIIMAAFAAVAILGISFVAYYVVIALSTITVATAISIGLGCIEWIKENKEFVTKQFENLLAMHFIDGLTQIKVSVKDTHTKIKNKLIELFGNDPATIEKFIKGELDVVHKELNHNL